MSRMGELAEFKLKKEKEAFGEIKTVLGEIRKTLCEDLEMSESNNFVLHDFLNSLKFNVNGIDFWVDFTVMKEREEVVGCFVFSAERKRLSFEENEDGEWEEQTFQTEKKPLIKFLVSSDGIISSDKIDEEWWIRLDSGTSSGANSDTQEKDDGQSEADDQENGNDQAETDAPENDKDQPENAQTNGNGKNEAREHNSKEISDIYYRTMDMIWCEALEWLNEIILP